MKRRGMRRGGSPIAAGRREPAYPVGDALPMEPLMPSEHRDRTRRRPIAHVLAESLMHYSDDQLVRLAEDVGRELERRRSIGWGGV